MSRAMAAGAALIALLLTSACGGDDPSASPSPSPSPSPSATSTTPTPPALPAAAKKNTKAGAIAFVRHYVKLINYAQATGGTSALMSASAPSCRSCQQLEQKAREIYDAGGHVTGGAWTVDQVVAVRSQDQWVVTVGGKVAPSTVHPRSGKVRRGTGGPANANFFVAYEDGWTVRQWKTFE